MSQCKKFTPNIFHKSKCSNCFRQKEEHSAEALECNRASRSIARSGYLFVAPDWDFSVPLNRTKRWQRRWFVLYDDGELNYSVDEHPDTVPQGSVDMTKVLEVTGAEQITGHPNSLALTSPDRVTFIKAASREDARWWVDLLAVFPRRHKRNATFPGGRASPSLPQLGRSASPQPQRPRHLSVNVTGASPRVNFETPPLKEERETKDENSGRPGWVPEPTDSVAIESAPTSLRIEYVVSSGSPPTRDKLRCDDKARARRDWRNERLRDIATALTDRSPESSLALPAEGLLHLKKGWLWLKTPLDEWVRKWIVLCGPTLNIFPDQDENTAPEMSVEMSTVTNYMEVPTESKYGFQIHWNGPALTLSAVTQGIRSNWLQALKKAAPIIVESPISPPTPRSVLFSSDEEYKTASEGGRRGSEDWSELPPSPPLNRLGIRMKDRNRLRPRLPRCQSRQSTLDSTSTDELDCGKDTVDLMHMNPNEDLVVDLQKQLAKSVDEVRLLEDEIARLKKLQSDAAIRERNAKDMLMSYEQTETELHQRNAQIEIKFLKEQKSLQRKLNEAEEMSKTFEEKCDLLCRELHTKQQIISNLQEELNNSNERLKCSSNENDELYKKLHAIESKYCLKTKGFHVESLTDLINIDLDLDIDDLGMNELKEYCLDLKCRFEKAIIEIRALKRLLRESEQNCDSFEYKNYGLQSSIDMIKKDHESEINLLITRLEHLTSKLTNAEKQLRQKSKQEKRRSLSLKGRESVSINKEVEDKVTELEAKIVALERGRNRRKYRRERSSERGSPIDDKQLRRLRRKSLDSATSSEPMKLLMRLTTLESKVSNVNASNESLNVVGNSEYYDNVISTAKTKITECLTALNFIKSRRASSPGTERLTSIEATLNEVSNLLMQSNNNPEAAVVSCAADSVVRQLQQLLLEKLTSLAEKKQLLRESNQLDCSSRLEILAEKVAYENVLISRIQEALNSSTNGDISCDRLMCKESRETAQLMTALQLKLTQKKPVVVQCKTSAEYLSKILAKCLLRSTQLGATTNRFIGPSSKELAEQQRKIDQLLDAYKSTKLPQLADALANEANDNNNRHLNDDTINEFSRNVRESVNSELIQSEINHVLVRAAQMYQSQFDADHAYFFSFFASERAALELWSDSVNDCLYEEINKYVIELTEMYLNALNKLQRQNWRRRVESERNSRAYTSLLREYSDIVAQKALIDARINVLSGKYVFRDHTRGDIEVDASWLELEKYWELLDNQSVQINQSLEAEFACLVSRYRHECSDRILNNSDISSERELDEVASCLVAVRRMVEELRSCVDIRNSSEEEEEEELVCRSWSDVCRRCVSLRDSLEMVKDVVMRSYKRSDFHQPNEHRPIYLGAEYLTQVENLRAAYRTAITCRERHLETDLEQLQQLCERVLASIEQWHRRTVQDLREGHAQEVEMLKQEKDQALAEETQATLAALDAMRKAHVAEVQREVAKFKQEFARQQRDEVLDLSERLSVKSLEAAALEEQLGSATRQLAHAQQHILKLERKPQLTLIQN